MRKIIIILLLLTFGLSQDFQPAESKQPVRVGRIKVELNYWNEPVLDSLDIIIPDSLKVTKDAIYRIFLYDEDGALVFDKKHFGNLKPYLTNAQKTELSGFMDKLFIKSLKLIPEKE